MDKDKDIEDRFTYHSPKGDQPEKYKEIRDRAKELAYLLNSVVPQGREKALAMTKLEECVFWSNAGIARS